MPRDHLSVSEVGELRTQRRRLENAEEAYTTAVLSACQTVRVLFSEKPGLTSVEVAAVLGQPPELIEMWRMGLQQTVLHV